MCFCIWGLLEDFKVCFFSLLCIMVSMKDLIFVIKKKKVFYEMRKEMKLLHTILFASMVMNMFREICFKDTLHN